MVTVLADVRRARHIAEQVPDPELPMLTLADLGVLREVRVTPEGTVVADLTPTYSGCPAMSEMRAEVFARLTGAGYERVEVRTVLDPPWTTDWITSEGRRKLAEHGIAPPGPAPRPAPGPVPLVLRVGRGAHSELRRSGGCWRRDGLGCGCGECYGRG
ncbi:1,2-phenylacetyl-CoA epoxidase subunit PaaD, partial [Streptomyces sp. SAS_269]|uniref:1,2-phenylacetyl-CoA epoxidase subunit PaaD n=1 Tax=Streptomyces sp. SAS_269 TaxID=3412749 RepID=UPI00403CC6ED